MKKRLFFASFLVVTRLGFADPIRPTWISEPPPSTRDIYAVGIGDGPSANEAQSEAKQRGWIEIVEQVVGTEGTSRSRATSTTEDSEIRSETEFSTPIVQFKTLVTIKKHIEPLESGGIRCYLLLKLPERELLRLRKLASNSTGGRLLGRVIIESEPSGAQVSLDGESTGTTPFKVLLPPKSYRIRIAKVGYRPFERTISLDEGKDFSLNHRLDKSTGTLIVHAEPGEAQIFVDDEPLGQGDSNSLITSGSHKVELRATGYNSQTRYVQVRENKEHELTMTLRPRSPKRTRQDSTPTPKLDSWDDQASKLVRKGRWPELAELGIRWLSVEPNSANANFYAGYGLLKLRRTDAALSYLQKSNFLHTNSVVLEALCEASNQGSNHRRAIEYCERSLQMDLKNPGGYAEIAKSYVGVGQPKKAYDNMMVAVSLNKAFYGNLRVLCRTTRSLHNHEECARINYPSLYR